MADRDLERALAALGRELDCPETPALSAAVRARLEAEDAARPPGLATKPTPLGRRRTRILAIAAAAVLLVGGAAVAARFALRGVDIVPTPTPPPASPAAPGRGLALGEAVTLDEARAAVPFLVRLPVALGLPDAVYVDDSVPDGRVTMAYRSRPDLPRDERTGVGLLFMQVRGALDEDILITKLPGGASVERVTVGRSPGFWLEGAHVVFLLDANGEPREETVRTAGNVLLWQEGDVTYRIEADIRRERAIAIAGSLG